MPAHRLTALAASLAAATAAAPLGGQPAAGVPGYAVARQEREIEPARGRNEVKFSDVAALIDPTTVMFKSLTDPKGTSMLEQNFQLDLVSTEKLLHKYVDRPIAVEQARGQPTESFTGTLLSTHGGSVLKRDDGSARASRTRRRASRGEPTIT